MHDTKIILKYYVSLTSLAIKQLKICVIVVVTNFKVDFPPKFQKVKFRSHSNFVVSESIDMISILVDLPETFYQNVIAAINRTNLH